MITGASRPEQVVENMAALDVVPQLDARGDGAHRGDPGQQAGGRAGFPVRLLQSSAGGGCAGPSMPAQPPSFVAERSAYIHRGPQQLVEAASMNAFATALPDTVLTPLRFYHWRPRPSSWR